MTLKKVVINFVTKLPYIKRLYKENLQFRSNSYYPAGHFYSPIISVDDIKQREVSIWRNHNADDIIGIDLQTANQLKLITSFEKYYNEMPFGDDKLNGLRYNFNNIYYSYTDAIVLYAMIRHFKPQQIIEIGSGFSSAVMLDTNELFFENSIKLTFIEPHPERL